MANQPVDLDDEQDGQHEPVIPAGRESRSVPENGPTFAAAQPGVQDLSKEIVQTVAKAVGQRVVCRRISGNFYRCNWWAPQDTGGYDNPQMQGMMVTTHRVVRSEQRT